MTLSMIWVLFNTWLTLRLWAFLMWCKPLRVEELRIRKKYAQTFFLIVFYCLFIGCSFAQVSHGTTQFSIQDAPFPVYASPLFLQPLLLATHPNTVLKWENVAISMINGFIHWIAITSFNQFIIPPSFLDLDSFAVETNWIGFTSRLSCKDILSCLWGLGANWPTQI